MKDAFLTVRQNKKYIVYVIGGVVYYTMMKKKIVFQSVSGDFWKNAVMRRCGGVVFTTQQLLCVKEMCESRVRE